MTSQVVNCESAGEGRRKGHPSGRGGGGRGWSRLEGATRGSESGRGRLGNEQLALVSQEPTQRGLPHSAPGKDKLQELRTEGTTPTPGC